MHIPEKERIIELKRSMRRAGAALGCPEFQYRNVTADAAEGSRREDGGLQGGDSAAPGSKGQGQGPAAAPAG